MKSSFKIAVLAVFSILAPLVHASEANRLLSRMEQAARTLDYEGIFVYQRGEQLDTMRIAHQVRNGIVRERLLALNGAPREIIRTDHEVRCYLPDESSVMVEHRRADNRSFPALLPESLSAIENNYRLKTGKEGRIAGRTARPVTIKPRDGFRYGYQLWADTQTGLLLKASLHDDTGAVIEQYQFTSLNVGKPLADSELEPLNPGKNFDWQRPEAAQASTPSNTWQAAELPAGYTLIKQQLRQFPGRKHPVQHLVFSDGMSIVSAFIEPIREDTKAFVTGLSHMGAVHVYGRIHEKDQITVVGEVPAAAVNMIGQSLAPSP